MRMLHLIVLDASEGTAKTMFELSHGLLRRNTAVESALDGRCGLYLLLCYASFCCIISCATRLFQGINMVIHITQGRRLISSFPLGSLLICESWNAWVPQHWLIAAHV